MSEKPRYIARGAGYTTDAAHAVDRLEAVPEQVQEDLTEKSAQRALDVRIRSRAATASEIEKELAFITARARYLERQLKKLRRAP